MSEELKMFIQESAETIVNDIDQLGGLSPTTYNFWKLNNFDPYYIRLIEQYLNLPITGYIESLVNNYLHHHEIDDIVRNMARNIKNDVKKYGELSQETYNFWAINNFDPYYIKRIENYFYLPITGDLRQLINNLRNVKEFKALINKLTRNFVISLYYTRRVDPTLRDLLEIVNFDPYYVEHIEHKLGLSESGNIDEAVSNFLEILSDEKYIKDGTWGNISIDYDIPEMMEETFAYQNKHPENETQWIELRNFFLVDAIIAGRYNIAKYILDNQDDIHLMDVDDIILRYGKVKAIKTLLKLNPREKERYRRLAQQVNNYIISEYLNSDRQTS